MELFLEITAVLIIVVMLLLIIRSYQKPKFYDLTQPEAFVGRMRYIYDNNYQFQKDKIYDDRYLNTIKIDHKLLGIKPETRKEVKQDGRKRKTTTVRKGRIQKKNGSPARSK